MWSIRSSLSRADRLIRDSGFNWYDLGVTRNYIELHPSDPNSAGSSPNPKMPEINVTFNIQVVPAFSSRTQFHLAPPLLEEAQDDERVERQAPASVIPTTDFPISTGNPRILFG